MTSQQTHPEPEEGAQQETWRVIRNPNDGTSQFRARVVGGQGIDTVLRAMFFCFSIDICIGKYTM